MKQQNDLPGLCARCVWKLKECGRPACSFPRCVKRKTDFSKAFTAHKNGQENQEQGGVDSSPEA